MSENVWDQHEFLYHYTTQSGLEGILKTQSLHATHFKYLNDRNEMIQLQPKLVDAVLPSVRKVISELIGVHEDFKTKTEELGGIESASEKEARSLIDVLYRVSFGEYGQTKYFQPYIISFCGHSQDYKRKNGLLSQWRAYAGQTGFAIVFRAKPLCDILLAEAIEFSYSACHIGDVIYDHDQEAMSREFGEFLRLLEELYPRAIYENKPDITSLFTPFVSCTSRYKHRGFHEESEVRAVFSPVSAEWRERVKTDDPMEYKKISGKKLKVVNFKCGFVPYIEINSAVENVLPIDRIIIGPSLAAENIKSKLEGYLELRGLKINVTISETPLC